MVQKTKQISTVEYVWVALLGGALTYTFTRLGFSILFSLHNWIDGLPIVFKQFVWILKTFPFFSFKEIFCFVAGAITASIAYHTVQSTNKYMQFLFFWIFTATLIYSMPKIFAISTIPRRHLEEPQSVVQEILWLNIYSLFCGAFSFILSLVLVEYVFRKKSARIHEILTRDRGGNG